MFGKRSTTSEPVFPGSPARTGQASPEAPPRIGAAVPAAGA